MRDGNESSSGGRVPSLPTRIWNGIYSLVRQYIWPLVALAGVISFILGALGYQETGSSWRDAIYQTTQLIVLESSLVGETVPWQLHIARFSLPIIGAIFGFGVALTIFAELKTLIWLWLFRHPLVIAGLGEPGFLLARSQRERGERVVVIELDPNNELIAECRKLGVSVLIGDATDPEVLRRARLNEAEFLISVCSDDSTNATVAMRAREITLDRDSGGLTCIVHVVEPQLCTLLMGYTFGGQEQNVFRLECFNIYQSGARAMLRQFPPFAELDASNEKPHLVIVGLGRLGETLLVQAARRWVTARRDSNLYLRVTVIDKVAGERVASLLERHPQLSEACELVGIDLPVESGELNRADFLFDESGATDVTRFYVCLGNDSLGLTAAVKLHHRLLGHNIPGVVRMKVSGFAALLEHQLTGDNVADSVRGFGLLEQTCDSELIEQSIYESMARAKHDDYVRQQEDAGQTPETNSSMVPWDQLPLTLKESNRYQAAHDRVKLRLLKYDIIPRTTWESNQFEFTAEEVDKLGEMEHKRWMDEKLRAGYTYAPGLKNDEKKTHPDLQSWDDLTDEVQQKDRLPMRRMPRLLADAEFQIVNLQPGQTDGNAT